MTSTRKSFRIVCLVLMWSLAAAGVLHAEPVLTQVFGHSHTICGVWGCGPPLSSLLVWHGFVAVLLVPSAAWSAIAYPQASARWGGLLFTLVCVAATIFVVVNTATWWLSATATARSYVFHRAGFATVAFTDAPVLPVLLAGSCYCVIGRSTSSAGAHLAANDES